MIRAADSLMCRKGEKCFARHVRPNEDLFLDKPIRSALFPEAIPRTNLTGFLEFAPMKGLIPAVPESILPPRG